MIIISFIAKLLSVLSKIIIARSISTYAISIYSLTLPTLSLLLNLCQLGIPTTISKLIAKKKYPTFKIMQVSFIILFLIDLIVGIIYILLIPNIAYNYLKNDLTLLTLYGMVFLIPLVSLTSLLKGYFIGIDMINVTGKCQISEEICRLLFIITFVDSISKDNISFLSFFAMASSIIGEIASLIHLVIETKINKKSIINRIKIENQNNKKISNIIIKLSILNTSTRLFGSLIYFFEPIIYTYLMLKNNISKQQLTIDYGIVNSYVFPLILLPSFFSNCISIFLLPKLSKYIENNNFKKSIKTFLFALLASLFSGLVCVILIYFFPEFFMKVLYGKVIGINFIKKYSFYLLVVFIQPIIHVALISFDKEKLLLFETIICNSIKIICFLIFIPLLKIDGMIISILISLYLSIIIHIYTLIKEFLFLKNKR